MLELSQYEGPLSVTCTTCERLFDYPKWHFGAAGSQYGPRKCPGRWICDICEKGFCSDHGNLGLCIPCFTDLRSARPRLELRDCGPDRAWPPLITFLGLSPNYTNRVLGKLVQDLEALFCDPTFNKFTADEALQGVPVTWQLHRGRDDCRVAAKELLRTVLRDSTERAAHALFARNPENLEGSWGLEINSGRPLDLLEPLDLILLLCQPTGRQLSLDYLEDEFVRRGFETFTTSIPRGPRDPSLSVEFPGMTLRDGTKISVRGAIREDGRKVEVLRGECTRSPQSWDETVFVYLCGPEGDSDLTVEFNGCSHLFYYLDELSESPDLAEIRRVFEC